VKIFQQANLWNDGHFYFYRSHRKP
jgi:hypothetical protein